MSPIAGQVDPLRLGYSWRANQIGVHYGKLLASPNVKTETVQRLVNDYPAHEVVIDEAAARHLFNEVRHSESVEENIFQKLHGLLRKPYDPPLVTSFRSDFEPEGRAEAIHATENLPDNEEPDGRESEAQFITSQAPLADEKRRIKDPHRGSTNGKEA